MGGRVRVAAMLFPVVLAACASPVPEQAASTSAPAVGASGSPIASSVPALTLHVATDGDDQNPGTLARPIRTLDHARRAVRAALSQNRGQSVMVSIAAGRYFLDAPLAFDAQDSPADGATVTYRGPPGADAVFLGARPLRGWEPVAGGVYRAPLGGLAPFNTLFENGQRATLARSPNEGYLRVAAQVGSASATQFVYAPGEIPSDVRPADLRVYIWAGSFGPVGSPPRLMNNDWEADLAAVKDIDRSARIVTLADPVSSPIRSGDRYVLQGPRALLDRPGEFAVDATERFVYYRPRAEPIERQEILAPTVPRIIQVKGTPASPVRNLVFERLTLQISDAPERIPASPPGAEHALVHLESAESIAIRSSRLLDSGGSGVLLRGHAQKIVVSGNLIERSGVHGVWVQGPFPPQPASSRANTISNNHIRSAGRLHGSGSGIKLVNSGENEVSNNRVEDTPRSGIALTGNTVANFKRFLPQLGVTEENVWDFVYTRGNVVRQNDVSRALTESQDAGGIYLWGAGKGNVIEENRVHEISGFTPEAIVTGIYLDGGSSFNIIRRNVIHGVSASPSSFSLSGIKLSGERNEITNNVVVASSGAASHVWSQTSDNEGPVRQNSITKNIFYAPAGGDLYFFSSWTSDRLAAADQNLLFSPGRASEVRLGFGRDRASLERWRAEFGFDRASMVADPLFADAARGDYSVRPGSPALGLGFVNIDGSKIGLLPDYPFPR